MFFFLLTMHYYDILSTQFGTMSADLASLAAALLAGGVIDSKDFEELENRELSLASLIDKLTIAVKKKSSESTKGLADLLEANKEQHGESEAFKALKQLVDSGHTSSCKYHIESSQHAATDNIIFSISYIS